ncbi:hypothetical protein [uncultured Pseudomonas sp.]|uniref:hypothetical protein n=1 Tax=uncultured Pseudomonas sp. TaxID=114707 RepID=UPI00258704A6|nr:hypothetical protein [uncultured Pseudomonas sp.]
MPWLSRCCVLLGCLLAPVAWALTGPELAVALNQSYQSGALRCAGNRPAYFCSGVLVRQQPANAPLPFWTHGPEAIGQGAERFSWLRHDVGGMSVSEPSGYIFSNRFEAMAQGKDYSVQGDDGGTRPGELRVVNWDTSLPERLAVVAVYYNRGDINGLLAAQRDQRAYHEAVGVWLPVLRLDPALPQSAVFGFDSREQLYRGYQVADRLNLRYADTAASCYDASPSYNCNGVLIRATGASAGFRSWNPTQNSISRDGVSFTYLRADTGVQRLASNEPGLIFDRLDQPVTHPVRLRCAYPANAGTSGIPNSCRASCLSQGITTVAAWRARYAGSAANSCAFSMEPTPNAAQFQLNIDVRASAGAHNEIIIGAWPQNIPRELPIEAIYYPSGSASLAGAKLIQRDYFQDTGVFMPVVRVNLASGNGQVFTFVAQDQNL